MAKNLVEVHEKAKTYDWAFTVGDQRPKWPTRYLIPPKGKDPFRMLIRDYVKMEAEKDDRTTGSSTVPSGWAWPRRSSPGSWSA